MFSSDRYPLRHDLSQDKRNEADGAVFIAINIKMSKKGKPVKGKVTAATKTVAVAAEPTNPLRELVSHLLHQGEQHVLGAKKALAQDKHDKSVDAIEKTLRSIVKEPRTTEMQRHAVILVTQLQINSGLTGPEARKIMAVIFTFLIIEIQRNWRDYGIEQTDVHPDFVRLHKKLPSLFDRLISGPFRFSCIFKISLSLFVPSFVVSSHPQAWTLFHFVMSH